MKKAIKVAVLGLVGWSFGPIATFTIGMVAGPGDWQHPVKILFGGGMMLFVIYLVETDRL